MNAVEKRAVRWLCGGDTGSSSETLCSFLLLGEVPSGHVATPSDAGDFGRCHRLLTQYVPEFRARIGEMAKLPAWEALAADWGELERLYLAIFEHEQGPERLAAETRFYQRIQVAAYPHRKRTSPRAGHDTGGGK